MIDEHVERLINRRLDGELTEDESLELDRQLIRSPEARALVEEYERAGALAGDALRAALGEDDSRQDRPERLARATASLRWPARVSRRTAVVAAAFVGVIIGMGTGHWLTTHVIPPAPAGPDMDATSPDEPLVVADQTPKADDAVRVTDGPHRREQRLVQDIVGVFNEETQSVYLLEASRLDASLAPPSVNY